MSHYHDTLFKKIKRLSSAVFLQCLWLIPLCGAVWYGKRHIGPWCADYFGLNEAQKMADYFSVQANQTSSPVMWNPGAIMIYLKALFSSMTASAKFNSLMALSDLITKLVSFLLNLVQFIGIIYALIRVKRAYFAQKSTDHISNTVCQEIMPEIEALRAEIKRLSLLIEGKENTPLPQPAKKD